MAKEKTAKIKIEKEEVVETPKEVKEEVAEISFPNVAGNGKFQAVKIGNTEKYAVYNPDGQRVSAELTLTQASDIVLRQNVAVHAKG